MLLSELRRRLKAAAAKARRKPGGLVQIQPETAERIAEHLRVAEEMPSRDDIARLIDGRKAGEKPSIEATMKANAVHHLMEGKFRQSCRGGRGGGTSRSRFNSRARRQHLCP